MSAAHHASVYYVDSVKDFSVPEDCVESEKIDTYFDRFGINDARAFVQQAQGRPLSKSILQLIVRTEFMTLEAQNALLKIVEEPPLSTQVTFIVPHEFTIIATLTSRLSIYRVDSAVSSGGQNAVFEAFLKQDYKDRISAIDQSAKKKDLDWQRSIKRGLVQYIERSTDKGSLASLEYSARLLLTRGASNKMLLEHAALLLAVRT